MLETVPTGASADPDQTTRPPAPAVIYTVAPPGGDPGFQSFSLEPAVTARPADPLATTATPAPVLTLASPSPTAGPTFTPPALPQTSVAEHYWFWRPIPEGGVVWTDKVYPFGSTRGGTLRPHHGVEFNVGRGTTVLAAGSGTVIMAGPDDGRVVGPAPDFYGKVVIIEHEARLGDQAVFTLYGHLETIYVTTGQPVQAKEVIALSGASGVADGPHLHFEVRVGDNSYGASRNPVLWLYPFPDRGTVAGRVTWPDGRPVFEAPLSLRRIDAPSRYFAVTSYADAGLRSDPTWGENFAFDDVDAGYYELSVTTPTGKVSVNLWVYPRRTSFVELTLGTEPR